MSRSFTFFLMFMLAVTVGFAAIIVTVEKRVGRQEQACALGGMQTIRIRETILCVRPDGFVVAPPRPPA